MYKQYVRWMTESSSLQQMKSYLNSNLFTRLPQLPAYFSDEVDVCPNQPIVLDFTRSRGYTKPKHEPVTRSNADLRIILDLTDAVPALTPYICTIFGVSKIRYSMLTNNLGGEVSMQYLSFLNN